MNIEKCGLVVKDTFLSNMCIIDLGIPNKDYVKYLGGFVFMHGNMLPCTKRILPCLLLTARTYYPDKLVDFTADLLSNRLSTRQLGGHARAALLAP